MFPYPGPWAQLGFSSLNPLAITQPGISTGSPASHLPVQCLRLRFSPHLSHTSGRGKRRRSQGWERSLGGLKQLIKKKNHPSSSAGNDHPREDKRVGTSRPPLPRAPNPPSSPHDRVSLRFKDRASPKVCETLLERRAWMPSLALPAELPSTQRDSHPQGCLSPALVQRSR